MKKYIIVRKPDGWYYASRKLFNIFNIGIMGYVNTTASSSAEGCVESLKKYVENKRLGTNKEKNVREISL